MQEWGREHQARVAALLGVDAFADEGLEADDVSACLWEDPDRSVVLGDGAGNGVVAGVLRRHRSGLAAHLQAMAVGSAHRRHGLGSALLDAFEGWAADGGASTVVVGAGAPFYLWPGVDFSWTPALAFFEAHRFTEHRPTFNMRFPDSYRAHAPAGVEVGGVGDPTGERARAVVRWCAGHHPHWSAELDRAIARGTAFAAWAGGLPLGFACHSVNRRGWVGPMATDPARRSAGVGSALLAALAADLRPLGLGMIEVAWVGPLSFYAKAAGARVSRVFRSLSRPIA